MTATDDKRGSLGSGPFATTYGWYMGGDTAWEVPCPWWRPPAIDFVAEHLPAGGKVLEWGAGGSTLWLAARCARLVSLELDGEWHYQVLHRLDMAGLLGVAEVLHCGPQQSQGVRWRSYADYILHYPDETFDLIVVDGRVRARCLGNALEKVKVGGMLLLDNSERAEYAEAVALLASWPRYDFGDGGWLTTVWFRPAEWEPPIKAPHLPVAEA